MVLVIVAFLLFSVALFSVAAALMTRDFWFFMILAVLSMLGGIGTIMYALLMEGNLV